jgi:hypothetical protein
MLSVGKKYKPSNANSMTTMLTQRTLLRKLKTSLCLHNQFMFNPHEHDATYSGIKLMRVSKLTAMPRAAKSKGKANPSPLEIPVGSIPEPMPNPAAALLAAWLAALNTETMCAPKPNTMIEKRATRPAEDPQVTTKLTEQVTDFLTKYTQANDSYNCKKGRRHGA